MAHDAQGPAAGPQKLVIRNIGLMLSGALENPILSGDTLVAENGRITAIGRARDLDQENATLVIDASGVLEPAAFEECKISRIAKVHLMPGPPVRADQTPRP